jgi:two-component system chemotaxis sensor kinase CheA
VDAAQYADLFLTESREHLSAINLALLDLERALTAGPDAHSSEAGGSDRAQSSVASTAVASLFRAVHTIKGMSATLRYDAVAALSHEMEALLDRFRRDELAPDATTMDVLFAAADVLESAIERAVGGRPGDERMDEIMARIAAIVLATPLVKGPKRRKASTRSGRTSQPRRATGRSSHGTRSAGREVTIRIRFASDAVLRGARAAVAVKRVRDLGEVIRVDPSEETFADEGAGPEIVEIGFRTTAAAAAITQHLQAVGDTVSIDVVRAAPARRSVAVPAPPNGVGTALTDGISRARHVRIDLRRLDALMNLIGELVIARGRLIELTSAQDESALTEAVADAGRLIGNLQEEIMTCRMVPVWQVFDRFPRLVRDAAHSLGKRVSFEVQGKEIELDRSMLDEIGDPIVHLLRNALDHGIEMPDARVATGKSAEGHLTLSAARDRSAVLIRVSDDGRGIDRSKVLARALEAGLVDPSTTALNDDEVIRLIARPGFTTADTVTDLSGRGVGIDAVQARVRALGGSVDIRSAPGEGTTVTARLPLTLAIMRALLARVGPETYAFPMTHVDETVGSAGAAFAAVRGQPVLLLRGEAVPFLKMREVVGLSDATAPIEPAADAEEHIIVVETGGRRTAVAVDELVGQSDIVVKQYDAVRGGPALFSGATILGDGAPALIVDVSGLL